MRFYGQITGTDHGVAGSLFIERNEAGTPVSERAFIPIEVMPSVVPVEESIVSAFL